MKAEELISEKIKEDEKFKEIYEKSREKLEDWGQNELEP